MDPLGPSYHNSEQRHRQHFKMSIKEESPELCSTESSLWSKVMSCICLWTRPAKQMDFFYTHPVACQAHSLWAWAGNTGDASLPLSRRNNWPSFGKQTLDPHCPIPATYRGSPGGHPASAFFLVICKSVYFFMCFTWESRTVLKILILKYCSLNCNVYIMDFVKM